MQRNSYRTVSYRARHSYGVNEFLNSYRYLLQRAIDVIRDSIEWIEKKQRNVRRITPVIPV